jgi:hypothetical protein
MKTLTLLVAALMSFGALSNEASEIIDYELVKQLAPYEELKGSLDVGGGVSLPYKFSITARGDGGINIGGIYIHTYDSHNDGTIFQDHLLKHQFVDVNRDGYLDLVISGVGLFKGVTEWDAIRKRTLVSIFIYDIVGNKYINTVPDEAVWAIEPEDKLF